MSIGHIVEILDLKMFIIPLLVRGKRKMHGFRVALRGSRNDTEIKEGTTFVILSGMKNLENQRSLDKLGMTKENRNDKKELNKKSPKLFSDFFTFIIAAIFAWHMR
jgi:hypothetical protein